MENGSVVLTCIQFAIYVFFSEDQDHFFYTKCKLVSVLEEKVNGWKYM